MSKATSQFPAFTASTKLIKWERLLWVPLSQTEAQEFEERARAQIGGPVRPERGCTHSQETNGSSDPKSTRPSSDPQCCEDKHRFAGRGAYCSASSEMSGGRLPTKSRVPAATGWRGRVQTPFKEWQAPNLDETSWVNNGGYIDPLCFNYGLNPRDSIRATVGPFSKGTVPPKLCVVFASWD